MLILARKLGESIAIGDKIRITVTSIEEGQIRLGVEAPREIAVHRKEVYDRIQEANQLAAQASRNNLGRIIELRRGSRTKDLPS